MLNTISMGVNHPLGLAIFSYGTLISDETWSPLLIKYSLDEIKEIKCMGIQNIEYFM